MVAVLDTVQQGARDLAGMTRSHGLWMAWNLFLAFIPLFLSALLFTARKRLSVGWWFGAVVFVLFLPNAPYVITDVVHLFDDIRRSRSDLQVLGLFLPVYACFFLAGMAAYTISLERLWRFAAARWSVRRALAIEVGLHLLCAVGVYLGRVVRLNSWQVFTRPQQVLGSLDWLVGPFPVFVILVTATVLGVASLAWRVVHAGATALLGPSLARRRGSRRRLWLDASGAPPPGAAA